MEQLVEKDFETDQEIRWCPGCGDYAILKQVKRVLADRGLAKEKIVFISGIGCSSRFPYYVDTYGLHSIHGRAMSVATGLKSTRPDLDVWVVTGDGDCLSIGGNHFIHTLRRNVDINVLMFNNKIYGLTKGQYSPTSEEYKITKSSPQGSLGYPFNTALMAMGAQGSFIARSIDTEVKHLQEVLFKAQQHRGTSFVEIYQNCNIFNDGAFDNHKNKQTKENQNLRLQEGEPLVFGSDAQWAIRLDGIKPLIVDRAQYNNEDLWIHDSSDTYKASLLARFVDMVDEVKQQAFPTPLGVLFQEHRTTFEGKVQEQMKQQQAQQADIDELIAGAQTWVI